MDPTILFRECRPYSATSGKYYVPNNDDLNNDPFGYYSGKLIGERIPEQGHLYFPNFPYESNEWNMTIPGEYED